MITKLDELSKDEKSLLLYLETVSVDYGGLVDTRRVNDDDRAIMNKWNKDKFIVTHRLTFSSYEKVKKYYPHCTMLTRLSPRAWKLAHEERKARAKRMLE